MTWFYLVRKLRTGEFCGFAKRCPFTRDGHFLLEPDDLWFSKPCKTFDEAMTKIKKETHAIDRGQMN